MSPRNVRRTNHLGSVEQRFAPIQQQQSNFLAVNFPIVSAFLKKRYPGVAPLDRDAVIYEVFGEYFTDESEPPEIGVNVCISNLITKANSKLIDQLRQNNRYDFFGDVAKALKEDGLIDVWGELVSRDCARQIIECFSDLIPDLPFRQQQVAVIMADHFPEKISASRIRAFILARHNEDVSEGAIRQARVEIRRRFRVLLNHYL